jgi:CHAD domain-containing protein
VADGQLPKAAAAAAAAGAAVVAGKVVKDRIASGNGESRAYRLKDREPVPDGIRRIARGRIDHAIDELSGRSDSSPEDAVHEARKDMKKLRALLRLVRGEIGGSVRRGENEAFRDAARALSGVRDADVMIATLEALIERDEARLPVDAIRRLGPALAQHRRALEEGLGGRDEALAAVVERLQHARGRVDSWPLEHDGFEAFVDGLERTYRRGRVDWRAARREPTVEGLHEWRKRVKDLWYHLSILRGAWPPVMDALAAEAHDLSDRLGDDHDLAVLRDWAATRPELLGEGIVAFDEAVERRRQELQADALAIGARLYADKPGEFAGRIGRWFGAWRGVAALR